MSAPSTTPSTTYAVKTSWYGGRKCKTYTQRVALTSGAVYQALGFNLPAKARVVHAHIRNAGSGITISGGINSSAVDGVALMAFPVSAATQTTVLTAPPANTASASNPVGTAGWFIAAIGTNTTESNGISRRGPQVEGYSTVQKAVNTYNADAFLAIVPTIVTASSFQQRATSTDTNLWNGFGTHTATTATSTTDAGSVDVVLYTETYDDYPT